MKVSNAVLIGAVVVSLGSLTGCFSISTMHTARPIEKGASEISFAPVSVGLVAPEEVIQDSDGSVIARSDASLTVPSMEGQFRHGFSDRFDMGVKLFLIGAGMDFNLLLVNKPTFAMSLDPGFTATGIGAGDNSVFIGTLWLPVLFDVDLSEKITLTVGPKTGLLIAAASGDSAADDSDDSAYTASAVDAMVGGMAGVKVQFTKSFYMMPEFNGVYEFDANYFWWTAALSFGFRI
ncbi:MAG: hypothetical protein JXX14_14345 [Deltaproteobacteria bacterium]|nr:hypothetical protein [Deltaproteobacteria bacterium]